MSAESRLAVAEPHGLRSEGAFPELLSQDCWTFVAEEYALTAQEQCVLRLACRGLGNRDIAQRLDITLPTVRTHMRSIYAKLGCANRVHLILTLLHQHVAAPHP